MNKTVAQLIKLRSTVYRFFGYAGAAYVAVGFYLKAHELFIFLSLIIAGLIIYYSLHAHFSMLIRERFAYVVSNLMDPALIEADARCVYSKTSRYWAGRFYWYYYESIRYEIDGEFVRALESCENMPARSKEASKMKDIERFHLYARMGELGKATALAPTVSALSLDKTHHYECTMLLGEYYLEMGFLNKAHKCLAEVYPHANSNRTKLHINFCLARLFEKEGRLGEAVEHYREAADIGPATWMGKMAGTRLEALAQPPCENTVC